MSEATPHIADVPLESPDSLQTLDKVTKILERQDVTQNQVAQDQEQSVEAQDVDTGEEYEDSYEDNSEEYEAESYESEEDSELYADEQIESDSESTPEAEPLYRVKVDGEEFDVPLNELRNGYSRQQHFTKQSQKLAEDKKVFESEFQQVQEERQQYVQLLSALEGQIKNMDSQPEPDWDNLYETDPIEASRQQHEWNRFNQAKNEKLQAAQAEKQRVTQIEQREQMEQYKTLLSHEAQRLQEVIPEWKDQKRATKEQQDLKKYLINQGVSEEEVSALVKADHVKVLRKAMLYDKGRRKVSSKTNNPQKRTRVMKSGAKLAPKVQDKFKKATSNLEKSGKWQDAAQAVSMLLND
tara:strand:- start:582 stop:1643 length:1062 start_codon:yes stop_codon:yes gene_type:complete